MGNLSFGGMLMAVGAFEQVQQSLRWFVDNVGVIADWRATLFRVGGLRCALIEMDRLGDQASRIELGWSGEDKLCLEDLRVISPTGYTTLSESRVEIMPKDHVLSLAPRLGEDKLVSRHGRSMVMGKRQDHSAAGRAHHVHAETPLYSRRRVARCLGLSGVVAKVHDARTRGRSREHGPLISVLLARSRSAMGQGIERAGPAGPRLRARASP